MSTNNNQTSATSATGSVNQPPFSTPSTVPVTDQGDQGSTPPYCHSTTFIHGTEQNFGFRTGGCRSALDPAHAAFHNRHFGKIAKALNKERSIIDKADFKERLDTILKSHHEDHSKISIKPEVFDTDHHSEFTARLDAYDTKADGLLPVEMFFKDRKGLTAAKDEANRD